MFVIRKSQLDLFSSHLAQKRIDNFKAYLRSQFFAALWPVDEDQLDMHVKEALSDAAQFGLVLDVDCLRYLNLAILYGWDFYRRPELKWTHTMLMDDQAGTPSQRLHRLVSEAIYRAEIEASRRESFRLSRTSEADVDNADFDGLILMLKE